MGEPDEPADFVRFSLEDRGQPYGAPYVARDLVEGLGPDADELIFYVQNYGRFRLRFDANTGDKSGSYG